MTNKTLSFLLVSIVLVILKSILVNTYDLVFIIFIVVFWWIIIYYAWSKWLRFLYNDFKNWFNNNVSFLWIFLAFLLFFLPLSSADKCLDSENEIFAWSLVSHCIEYNPDYKEEYTYINILSYILYLFIALYFYLLNNPKKVIIKKDNIQVKEVIKPNKKEKII